MRTAILMVAITISSGLGIGELIADNNASAAEFFAVLFVVFAIMDISEFFKNILD